MKRKFAGKEFKLYSTYPRKELAKKNQKRLKPKYYTRITEFMTRSTKHNLGYDLWFRGKK